jgi:hypothetical protein
LKPLMTIPGPGRRRRSHPVRSFLLLVLLIGAGYLGVFAVRALGYEYPLVRSAAAPSALRGAFHVHSTRSDGRRSVEEIASAARAAGLHFVVFTDHNPETAEPARYHDGVLLIFGAELSTPHGHVIALGTSRAVTPEERAGAVLDTVSELGGHAVLAHPVQRKNPWRDWASAPKAAGLELYSADTMFRSALARPLRVLAPAAAAWATHSVHGLMMVASPEPAATELLLSLAAERPMVGLCAHDAHGLPSYESVFSALATYVPPGPEGLGLPQDAEAAADRVVSALVSGESWCAFHAIAAGDGFALRGVGPERSAVQGEVLTVELPAAVPEEVQVRVHGPATLLEDGRSVRLDGAGAVQVEVWARVPGMFLQDGWKPWLVPSPVRVVAVPPGPGQPGSEEAAVAADH